MRVASVSLIFVALAVAAGLANRASAVGETRLKQQQTAKQQQPTTKRVVPAQPETQTRGAEPISASAQQQIAALMAEKAARTPAQKKMDSRLIYAAKMARGEPIAAGVETLDVDIPSAGGERVFVDITAEVSPFFLTKLKELGGELLIAHPRYRSVRAEVNLSSVEAIAALPEVINIRPMDEAIVWRQDAPKSAAPAFDPERLSPYVPGLEPRERERTIAKRLAAALDELEPNAYNVNVNGFRKSEADTTMRGAVARNTYGFDGTGIKIGVLSDGVRALASAQAAGDIGPVTVVPGQSGTSAGQCTTTTLCDEGTAMLELVHDLAPGAQLFFATALGGSANFATNIRTLRDTYDCDIIIDDIFYFAESPFQDGQAPSVVSPTNGGIVTQAVNDVTADGAMYFSSAGNSGNDNDGTSGVWEGDYVDGGPAAAPIGAANGNVHTFPAEGATPAQNFNVLTVASGPIILNWSDPLGASSNDYDLYALNAAGTTITAASTGGQDGNDDPFEGFNSPAAGSRIVIVKFTGAARFLRISTNRGQLTVDTAGQTSGHACAANAFALAAVSAGTSFPLPHDSADPVETFSSDGPRKLFFQPDGTPFTPGDVLATGGITRQKPDITATDQASVTGTGGFPIVFGGTSAAAPHAGAVAALLKSANPALTNAQIRTALQSTAIDIEAPGVDRDSGFGIVMADAALASLGLTPSAANVSTGMVTADAVGGNANGFIEPGERGTLAVQLVNTGNAAATTVTATLSTTTPNVFITPPASRSYPDIAATSGTSSSATPFEFVLQEGATYGVSINFVLTVTYNGTATRTFPITIPTGRLANISTTLDTTAPTAPPEATLAATGTQTGRANFTFPISSCGTTKTNPGTTSALARRFDSYTFTNTSASTICVTVLFAHSSTALLHAVAYVPTFVPATPTVGYAGDGGGSATNGAGTAQLFSFNVAAGQTFTVVVSESNQNGGLGVPYTLRVSGLPAQAVPANQAPVITSPATANTNEDTPITFTAGGPNEVSVADADAGSNPIKVTLQSTNGTLTLDGTTGLSFTTGDGTADSNMVFTGSAANINAALDGATFAPAPGYSGPATVQIDVDDQGFTGTGGPQTDSATINITVAAVNDLSVSDVQMAEGNTGTTAFTFNVTLEAPAGPGGVTFNASTADGTASSASDYTGFTNQPGSIPEGSSSTTVTVQVNGDTTQEPNETFFVNITNITGAQAGDPQGTGTILNDDGAPGAGQVVISEFRLRGPGADPTAQSTNEYIEIYNATDSDFVVADRAPVTVGTAGWAIVSSDAPLTPKYVIPAGTVIPARGHFLVTGGNYSLSAYAAADAPGGSPAIFFADIPDGAGLALFRTGTPLAGSEAAGDILDRAGFRVSGAPYVEGLGLTPQGGVTSGAQHSFVRQMVTGMPQDTGDNEADFAFVSTDGAIYNGRQSTLGAPGPENTASPIVRNAQFGGFLIDGSLPSTSSPNRTRDLTSDPGGDATFGTMSIRRRFTNSTGTTITSLRFRVVIITGHPVTDPANADLRLRTSVDESGVGVGDAATCSPASAPCTVTVRGTVLEAPSVTNNGGLNSTVSVDLSPPVAANNAGSADKLSPKSPRLLGGKFKPEAPQMSDTIPLAAPLANGESINVQFVFGIQKTGKYRFFINVEALP
jgi:hypothetical protein